MATEEKRMRQRGDTAADWSAANPTLAKFELGIEQDDDGSDTKFKIGDGVTAWNDLGYWVPGGVGGGGEGTVVSVNNVSPDGSGNVSIAADDIAFTATATIAGTDIQAAVVEVADDATAALASHGSAQYVGAHVPTGGTEGQYLRKSTGTTMAWDDVDFAPFAAMCMITVPYDEGTSAYIPPTGLTALGLTIASFHRRMWVGPTLPKNTTGGTLWEEGDYFLSTLAA